MLASIETALATVAVPLVVGLIASGPSWLAAYRARQTQRSNTTDHGRVAERLSAVEGQLEHLHERLTAHVEWEESHKYHELMQRLGDLVNRIPGALPSIDDKGR